MLFNHKFLDGLDALSSTQADDVGAAGEGDVQHMDRLLHRLFVHLGTTHVVDHQLSATQLFVVERGLDTDHLATTDGVGSHSERDFLCLDIVDTLITEAEDVGHHPAGHLVVDRHHDVVAALERRVVIVVEEVLGSALDSFAIAVPLVSIIVNIDTVVVVDHHQHAVVVSHNLRYRFVFDNDDVDRHHTVAAGGVGDDEDDSGVTHSVGVAVNPSEGAATLDS